LDPLVGLLQANSVRDPDNIAARPRQVRHNAGLDPSGKGSDDRNGRNRRLQIEDEVIANGNDQIRIAAHHVAGQVRIIGARPSPEYRSIKIFFPSTYPKRRSSVKIAQMPGAKLVSVSVVRDERPQCDDLFPFAAHEWYPQRQRPKDRR
jgi:hypothetical protein